MESYVFGPGQQLKCNRIKSLIWIKRVRYAFSLIILISAFTTQLSSQIPVVTARFANPSYNCAAEYCVDVEFRSNTPDVQIFGVNIRFFYADTILELIGFSDFQGGYGPVEPNPPIILTSSFAGSTLFNLNGPADFVNGAIQLVNPLIVTYLDTGSWTKLFQVCFHIDDPNANVASFCPSLIWDLELYANEDGYRDGYLSGDDGVVITLVDPTMNTESISSDEDVVQFNWMYSGNGTPPYGTPIANNCTTLTPDCNPYISCPAGITVECGGSTSPSITGFATSSDICNGDPVITFSDTEIGGPCAQQYSILRRWITTNACGFSDTCFQSIQVIDTQPPVITCPVDMTVLCPTIPVFATPVVTDVCDPSTIITFTDLNIPGACPGDFSIKRTWKATDHCGNFSTCMATIYFSDETGPLISCPVNVTIECQEDNSSAHTGVATATDDCSTVLISQSQTSSQNPDVEACGHYTYVISRQWIAMDACGNSNTCVQTINVRDITPPAIFCPANITILNNANTLPANTGNASGIDNCDSDLSISYSDVLSPNVCPSIKKITRTWTATDACGNFSTCQQNIVIDDRGSICGSVHDDLGQAMPGVEIKLMADVNNNQVFDAGDTLVAIKFSDVGTGQFCFTQIRPCNYVLVETQPASYGESSDFDTTPDPDGNDSGDGPDNQIPVVLTSAENDNDNNFIDIICPTQLPVIPPDTICANGSVVFQISAIPLGTLTYSWAFGSGSSPGTGAGLGPHTVSYVTTTDNQANGSVIAMNIQKAGCPDLTGSVSHIEINPYPNAAINPTSTDTCYYSNWTFQPVAAQIPGATYIWTFGADAVPTSATGYGPHIVYYTTSTIQDKVVKLVVYPNEPGSQCPASDSIHFHIGACPALIHGTVKSVSGTPIQGVNLRLYADNDLDGIQDNATILKNVFTNAAGEYLMGALVPGNRVIVQVQPNGWFSVQDIDVSDDGDLVTNNNPLDNVIPATLTPGESDLGNNFVESPTTGSITGSVFLDNDGDEVPDAMEGVSGVTIKVFSDSNTDGHADNSVPLFTQVTSAAGFYNFNQVPIGSYVIAETQPINYTSVKDFDATNDSDIVPNTNVHNDTIPVTITSGEPDEQNYFIDAAPCNLLVSSTLDSGPGTLRAAIACAEDGDTILFANSLSGMTINFTSTRIEIGKHLTILSTLTPRITISSQVAGLFKILNIVEFRQIDFMSGMTVAGNGGAAFENLGVLSLHDVHIIRNPSLPNGQYLICNVPNSNLQMKGNCYIQMN